MNYFKRTSDSINEGLPIKRSEINFKENDIFIHEKDSTFKSVFRIGQVPFKKNMGRNAAFAIQLIGNRKSFTEVLPPTPVTKLILLHTVVVLHLTHHIQMS